MNKTYDLTYEREGRKRKGREVTLGRRKMSSKGIIERQTRIENTEKKIRVILDEYRLLKTVMTGMWFKTHKDSKVHDKNEKRQTLLTNALISSCLPLHHQRLTLWRVCSQCHIVKIYWKTLLL